MCQNFSSVGQQIVTAAYRDLRAQTH